MKNKAAQLIIKFLAAALISTAIYLLKPFQPDIYIFFFLYCCLAGYPVSTFYRPYKFFPDCKNIVPHRDSSIVGDTYNTPMEK